MFSWLSFIVIERDIASYLIKQQSTLIIINNELYTLLLYQIIIIFKQNIKKISKLNNNIGEKIEINIQNNENKKMFKIINYRMIFYQLNKILKVTVIY